MECTKEGCQKQPLSKEEKAKYDNCNYKGHVISDPDSKVSFIQCDENGVKDISIVSDKVKKSKEQQLNDTWFF